MHQSRLYQCLLAILFGALISMSTQVNAASKEQAVKAGFIYNFTKFTVWPTSADDQFNLCVVGDKHLGDSLKALSGKLVHNRPLTLRRSPPKKDLHTCHIALISTALPDESRKLLEQFKGLAVLTISDNPNFIDHGGMIGLVRNGRYVGFEVNLIAVKAAQLNISAQLLKLAKKVKGLK